MLSKFLDWWWDHPRIRWLFVFCLIIVYFLLVGVPGIDRGVTRAQVESVSMKLDLLLGQAKINAIQTGRIGGVQVSFENPQRLVAFLKSDYGGQCELQNHDQVLEVIELPRYAPLVAIRSLDGGGGLEHQVAVCVEPELGGYYKSSSGRFTIDIFRKKAPWFSTVPLDGVRFIIEGKDLRVREERVSQL